jgi:two-component system chemotaxis response regulator CheY
MPSCLVVDDSRVIRKVACRILEEFSFAADEAEDQQAALDLCRAHMPDVIFFDGDLPAGNGLDFVRALRRERGGDKPVIVYCVTEADQTLVGHALGAGANEYMLKPYDRVAIREKLTEVGFA